jgi:enoyl-[acyl-carrier-protein] reductase (NADH)
MPKNALILGVSSGFGKASAFELAKKGFNIFGVHLDIGANKTIAEEQRTALEAMGVKAKFYNTNAAEDSNRKDVINDVKKTLEDWGGCINLFMHSLAFGALGKFFTENPETQIGRKKMEMTMDVMANSLLYWSQDLFNNSLFKPNSRIIAMSSVGSTKAMPYYGALAAAKAALEAYIRQIAIELAPYKITANTILAGITDTPAGRKIPHFDKMLEFASSQNPHHRNSTPEDVAKMIALIADENSYWMTGNVLSVDGGESIASIFE